MSPRTFFRSIAIAETITWSLLIIGMLLKYAAGAGALPVLIAGSIHGLVFVTYAVSCVLVGVNQRWHPKTIALGIGSAILPYATIPFDVKMDRTGRLDGDWHREASDEPHDQLWTRRLLRWFLARPAALVAVFVLAVAVILGGFLIVGPPGGWQAALS